jgi:hypothetical protein
VYGQAFVPSVTNALGPAPGLLARLGYGTGGDTQAWSNWYDALFNRIAGNNNEFMQQLLVNDPGSHHYAYRYSFAGGPSTAGRVAAGHRPCAAGHASGRAEASGQG